MSAIGRCVAVIWLGTRLQDVGTLVGDEQDVKLLEWLINESHIGRLYRGVLRVGRDELGE